MQNSSLQLKCQNVESRLHSAFIAQTSHHVHQGKQTYQACFISCRPQATAALGTGKHNFFLFLLHPPHLAFSVVYSFVFAASPIPSISCHLLQQGLYWHCISLAFVVFSINIAYLISSADLAFLSIVQQCAQYWHCLLLTVFTFYDSLQT